MFNPKVSIVIPVYNGSNYLKEAIDSALMQTYENLEIIVVNDGSNDGGATESIALSYGDKIRYYKKKNGGVSTALNYGISVMTGEYFSWLSHDDLYTPSKISDSVKLISMQENKDRLVACCGSFLIDGNGELLKKSGDTFDENMVYCEDVLYKKILKGRMLNGCSLLIPKLAFEEIGLFDETLKYSQDALMWYKMFFGGYSLIFERKENVMRRMHNAQGSVTIKDKFYEDSVYIAKMLIPIFVKKSNKKENFLLMYAKRSAKHCPEVTKMCIDEAKKTKKISLLEIFELNIISFYGKNVRDIIRKLHYGFLSLCGKKDRK